MDFERIVLALSSPSLSVITVVRCALGDSRARWCGGVGWETLPSLALDKGLGDDIMLSSRPWWPKFWPSASSGAAQHAC